MTITLGTPATFNPNGGQPIDIAKLTSSLAIAIYEDTTAYTYYARTITIGDPPTPNAEVSVDTATVSVGNHAVIVGLTATTAMVVYNYSGTSVVRARILSVSGTTITVNSHITLTDATSIFDANFVSTTSVLYCYNRSSGARARILSVSGTTITENAEATINAGATAFATKCASFSGTRAIMTWTLGAGNREGRGLVISGTSITTPSAKQTIVTGVSAGNEDRYFTKQVSSTKIINGAIDSANSRAEYNVLTLSGTSFNIGASTTKALTDFSYLNAAKLDDTSLVIANNEPADTLAVEKYNLSGAGSDELTSDGTDTSIIANFLADIKAAPVDDTQVIIMYWGDTSLNVVAGESAAAITLAAMTKPADVDAAGEFIYVALLEGGVPILTKISTALDADGTTVFNPGAGDNIGVECGRFNSDVIWVAGNFDGTNVIEKSEDGGNTFSVKDNGAIGDIRSFVMGPDSDDRLLVFDETNGDILETRDDGESWTTINGSVTPEINAIGRLGENVQESVFGNDGGANDSINYSVNSGDDLEDYQTGVYPNANATRVIVN